MKNYIKITIILFCLVSCGKKNGIEYEGGQKIPNFDKVFDE